MNQNCIFGYRTSDGSLSTHLSKEARTAIGSFGIKLTQNDRGAWFAGWEQEALGTIGVSPLGWDQFFDDEEELPTEYLMEVSGYPAALAAHRIEWWYKAA
jgi:hypothetical protein